MVLHEEKGVAVLVVPNKEEYDYILQVRMGAVLLSVPSKRDEDFCQSSYELSMISFCVFQEKNITIDSKEPTFSSAFLVWDLTWVGVTAISLSPVFLAHPFCPGVQRRGASKSHFQWEFGGKNREKWGVF